MKPTEIMKLLGEEWKKADAKTIEESGCGGDEEKGRGERGGGGGESEEASPEWLQRVLQGAGARD